MQDDIFFAVDKYNNLASSKENHGARADLGSAASAGAGSYSIVRCVLSGHRFNSGVLSVRSGPFPSPLESTADPSSPFTLPSCSTLHIDRSLQGIRIRRADPEEFCHTRVYRYRSVRAHDRNAPVKGESRNAIRRNISRHFLIAAGEAGEKVREEGGGGWREAEGKWKTN